MYFSKINHVSKKLKLGLTGTTIVVANLAHLNPAIAEETLKEVIPSQVNSLKVKGADAKILEASAFDQLKQNVINPVAVEINSKKPLESPVVESTNSARTLNINLYDEENNNEVMTQIPSVSELRDVQPTDWAFQALQSLVERYGCITEDFDDTDRGNRTLTRYEFAANLNTCLDRIRKMITSETGNLNEEDLAILEKLQSEFSAELANLENRIDSLELRTAQLENNQFSTTVTLSGNAIFSVLNYFSGDGENQFVLQQQSFLMLSASFTGRDNLSLGIAASNGEISNLVSTNDGRDVGSTGEGLTTWEYGGSTGNNVVLGNLEYTFPIIQNEDDNEDDKLYLSLALINGFNSSRFLPPVPNLTWGGNALGSGPVSAFAQQSPLYRLGGGAGLITEYDSGPWRLTLAYLAGQASNPSPGAGLFNGDFLAFAQLNFTPSDRFALALTYQHNYFGAGRFAYNNRIGDANSSNFVGTALANRFDNEGVFFDENIPVVSNTYGIQAYWRISPEIVIGGFAAKTDARLIGRGDADIWTYGLNLSFPDLGKEGNLGGLIVGMEPTLTGINAVGVSPRDFERDTSLHIEAFYRYQLTDNISITPAVIWITDPNQDADNEDIVEGVIRTTFSF